MHYLWSPVARARRPRPFRELQDWPDAGAAMGPHALPWMRDGPGQLASGLTARLSPQTCTLRWNLGGESAHGWMLRGEGDRGHQ